MNIGKMQLLTYEQIGYDPEFITFVRGAGARVYRCCNIPQTYYVDPERLEILKRMLRKISYLEREGVYYIKPMDFEAISNIIDDFRESGFDAVFVDEDRSFRNRWGWPMQEYLN